MPRWLPQDKGQELAVAQHKSIKHDITAANSQSREDFLGDGLCFRCVQLVLADVHIFDMLQTACLGLGSQGGKVSAGEVARDSVTASDNSCIALGSEIVASERVVSLGPGYLELASGEDLSPVSEVAPGFAERPLELAPGDGSAPTPGRGCRLLGLGGRLLSKPCIEPAKQQDLACEPFSCQGV